MGCSDHNTDDRFLRLYREHETALRWYARSLASTMDEAQEVLGNTAKALRRGFDQLDAPENFRQWAFDRIRHETGNRAAGGSICGSDTPLSPNAGWPFADSFC